MQSVFKKAKTRNWVFETISAHARAKQLPLEVAAILANEMLEHHKLSLPDDDIHTLTFAILNPTLQGI